jgi:hypothetical protein
MGITLLRQLYNIAGSSVYDDEIVDANTVGVAEAQTRLEGDLNIIRTHLKGILGETNWYDAPGASLSNLKSRVEAFEDQTILAYVYSSVSSPKALVNAQNYIDIHTEMIGVDFKDEAFLVTNLGILASVTKGATANTGDLNKVSLSYSGANDPIDDGLGNQVYGYLVVDALDSASRTSTKIYLYSDIDGTETSWSANNTNNVNIYLTNRSLLSNFDEKTFLHPMYFDVAQEVNIGSLLYTEDNFISDRETITSSLDKLDQELKDAFDSLGIGAGDDTFTFSGTNYLDSVTNVKTALETLDTVINTQEPDIYRADDIPAKTENDTLDLPFIADATKHQFFIQGVIQHLGSDYTIAAGASFSTITFIADMPANSNIQFFNLV